MNINDLIASLVMYGVGGGLACGSIVCFAGYAIRKVIDFFRQLING